MSHPPALIFDFGNVVAHFDYAIAGARLGRSLGLSGDAFIAHARSRGLAELLKVYEAGRIDTPEFHRQFCELTGLPLDLPAFTNAWADIFTANESVHEVIRHLADRGYTLVLGSNTNAIHADHFLSQFAELLGLFKALVLSHEVGHIKPTSDFYHACAEAAGRPPGECVFIDDLAENVDGARRAGLVGLLYSGTPQLIHDLRGLGIALSGF